MGHSCGGCGSCDHNDEPARNASHSDAGGGEKEEAGCGCGHDHSADGQQISHEDMEKLMKAIEEAGYQAAETPDGDIKISE